MKTFIEEGEEQKGSLPASTYKCKIEGIERRKTSERSKTPGALMYEVQLSVVEPKQYKGFLLRDYFVIGTADDLKGRERATWQRSEGGPGKLTRLFVRSGAERPADDEEWNDALSGHEVCAVVTVRKDDNGDDRNNIKTYFRETDEDCPEIGEASAEVGRTGGAKRARAAWASKKAAAREEPEEVDTEEEEVEEKPTAKASAKGKKRMVEEDDED